jgi:hypothetical protein
MSVFQSVPIKETFGRNTVWEGLSGQFWALYFLQQVSKLDSLTTAYIVGGGLVIEF